MEARLFADERLSHLIGHLYDAAIDPGLWPSALKAFCEYVGGSSGALFWHDSASTTSGVSYEFNGDPHFTRSYFETYVRLNPVFPAASFIAVGAIQVARDIVPEKEMVKTRFYKEWLAPQKMTGDAVGAILQRSDSSVALVAVRWHERDGIIDNDVRRRAALVVPHLQRAVLIGRLFDQNKRTEETLVETLGHVDAGVFLVGPKGLIVFSNRAGERLLEEGALLRAPGRKLIGTSPDCAKALRAALDASEKGDGSIGERGISVPLSPDPDNLWFAHVLPLTAGARRQASDAYQATAVVFVKRTALDSQTALEFLARKFKLTAMELRVFAAVLNVRGVKEIAETLGISQSTTRTHLKHLFQKCGAKRQSDLVKLMTDRSLRSL